MRAVLLTGQPGIFTSGNDIEDFMQRPPAGEESPAFRFMKALIGCDKPVVAAVTGAAIGIGTTMLLHCDFVYVSERARFNMPFVQLGLCAEGASSLLLPRMAGFALASELLLFGEPFDAATAQRAGLVNKVVPAANLQEVAAERASALASRPAEVRLPANVVASASTFHIKAGSVNRAIQFPATSTNGTFEKMFDPTTENQVRFQAWVGGLDPKIGCNHE